MPLAITLLRLGSARGLTQACGCASIPEDFLPYRYDPT
jgi:hypothetical protein